MRSGAYRAGSLLALSVVCACAKSGPSAEEQRADDERRERELQAEIALATAPYERAIVSFFAATSTRDFDAAYGMLAPSYTNMVKRESFTARIQTNDNLAKPVSVKILHTRAQAGTTHVRCVLGSLGLAEIDFATATGTPRISAFALGGMQVLPSPP